MPTSYNGWSAGEGWSVAGGQLEKLIVAGEPFAPGVRAGDVHDVLEYVANQIHLRVQPVTFGHSADDWGYSYRANVNNPSQLSCHASATAIDYNAVSHPNGKSGTWTPAQKAEILKILAEVNNVVVCLWGYDEMHFEIRGTAAAVATAATRVRAAGGSASGVQVSAKYPIIGRIADTYRRVGPAVLGVPLGPEVPTLDPVGRWQNFEFGRIYFHPSVDGGNAHALQGEIEQCFKRLGCEPVVGWPTTDESVPFYGSTGRYNHFTGGWSIYWTPEVGRAFEVHGRIRDKWAELGWERSALGYPISGEVEQADGKIIQRFQHGGVVWDGVSAKVIE